MHRGNLVLTCFLIGAFLTVMGGYAWWKGAGSESWSRTSGVVREAQKVAESGTRAGWRARARVEYEYEVGGKTYRSQRLYFRGNQLGRQELYPVSVLREYRVGTKVTVYYDRSDPHEAVVQHGAAPSAIAFSLGGIAALALGAWTASRAG